jgi:hypothetical protein
VSYVVGCYCCTCKGVGRNAELGWDPACRNHGAHGLRGCVEHQREPENCDCGCGYKVTDRDSADLPTPILGDAYLKAIARAEAAEAALRQCQTDYRQQGISLSQEIHRLQNRTS